MIKLNRIFSKLVNEQILTRDKDQMVLKTTATKPIADAVVNRKKIDFFYNGPRKGKDRVKAGKRFKVEPFAIGITKKGKLALRAWVDSGSGSTSKKGFNLTNWRTFILSRMRNIKITDETFTIRPGYKHGEEGNEGPIQKILVSTDFTQKPKVKKVTPKVTTKKVEPEVPKVTGKKPSVKITPQVLPQPKPEIKPTELPSPEVEPKISPVEPEKIQPKPKTEPKPEVLPEPKPEEKPKELSQPNPEEKPEEEPEEGSEETLKENIMRIKSLMLL